MNSVHFLESVSSLSLPLRAPCTGPRQLRCKSVEGEIRQPEESNLRQGSASRVAAIRLSDPGPKGQQSDAVPTAMVWTEKKEPAAAGRHEQSPSLRQRNPPVSAHHAVRFPIVTASQRHRPARNRASSNAIPIVTASPPAQNRASCNASRQLTTDS
jgi:hypothetical protein